MANNVPMSLAFANGRAIVDQANGQKLSVECKLAADVSQGRLEDVSLFYTSVGR